MQPTVTKQSGTAFTYSLCSPKYCCPKTNLDWNRHHVTIAHINTTDQTIIDKARSIIDNYVKADCPHIYEHHGHKMVSYSLGKQGPNSTFLEGNIALFKEAVQKELKKDPQVAAYLSPLREAHFNRLQLKNPHRPLALYQNISINQVQTMKS